MPAPTGLVANEIGVIGHSNVGTFIDYYRTISSRDLLPPINHGSYDIQSWGDPNHEDYAAAWAKVDDDMPVGGFRAFWLMLGFRAAFSNENVTRGWTDHIAGRLASDYPVEWVWWSPMNTYFATNPGDGDAASLVTLDPWGTNPQGLTTWKASDAESRFSWNNTKYAIAQGYADDYGPWINLTDAETDDTDDRHPTEAPGDPIPNGQSHGGDALKAFFDEVAVDQPPPPGLQEEFESNRMGGIGAVRRAGRR